MNTVEANVRVVLDAFGAVERRDGAALLALCQPDARFHWPPSLVYGGSRGLGESNASQGRTFEAVWDPVQPTQAERSMDPRVVAASDREVVVLWRQRGLAADGERFNSPVLGLYEVREGRLARAQMFYFDPGAVSAFLNRAARAARLADAQGSTA
ncbi:MAG TPA: nuclear transport factor 2 family protein [Candidatus Dormibacteraeota bacterium]|nr:nuclear transport factor 2 family protein [Candidatus Dormibacteraeota bacterium]